MKRKSILIFILILVIGFALVSTTLILNGNTLIGKNENDFSIYFSEAILDGMDKSNQLISEDRLKIDFESKKLTITGEISDLDYEVTNASKNYDAKVEVKCVPLNHEHFELTHTFESEIIKAKESKRGNLIVKLTKPSIEEQSIKIECVLDFEAIERSSVGEETKDNNIYHIKGYLKDNEGNIIPNAHLMVEKDGDFEYYKGDDYGYIYINGLEKGSYGVYLIDALDSDNLSNLTSEQIKAMSLTYTQISTNQKKINFDNGYEISECIIEKESHESFKVLLKNTIEEEFELQTNSFYNLPIPEKEGYSFAWYDGEKEITNNTFIIEPVSELVGKYTKNESIYDAINNPTLQNGVQNLSMYVNETLVKYPARVYLYEGNQLWESKTFGETTDVGSSNSNAKYMEVVKVKGNLTINQGQTITTYRSSYGGPKGMTINVEGSLTNNGTITMSSRGAKAVGENIYLYKNADNSYEYVPATGGAGGTYKSYTCTTTAPQTIPIEGENGKDGFNRGTGGGGGGAIHATRTSATFSVKSGAGSIGTSYSGGTGGGGIDVHYSVTRSAGSGGANGLSGGNAYAAKGGTTWASRYAGGGAGNPGGIGQAAASGNTTGVNNSSYNGENGTGGLLNIYTGSFANNSKISSDGSLGGGGYAGGGSSGGGSINIFSKKIIFTGELSALGGKSNGYPAKGGAGGTGSITFSELIDHK